MNVQFKNVAGSSEWEGYRRLSKNRDSLKLVIIDD